MEYKNYPDTTTPLNATNLNKLIQKNCIKARLGNEDYALQQTDVWEKLPLSYKEVYSGNEINMDTVNHDIIIGKGINYILVSAQIYWYNPLVINARKVIRITKNGEMVVYNNLYPNADYLNHSIPNILIPVQENDRISLEVKGNQGDVINRYGTSTYLTVVAVG